MKIKEFERAAHLAAVILFGAIMVALPTDIQFPWNFALYGVVFLFLTFFCWGVFLNIREDIKEEMKHE